MKLDARRVPAFLRDPGACRVVLLHGEDGGLIRERAEALVRTAAGSLNDPFRVAELARDTASDRLAAEASALSLIGGRRAVWVHEAGDSLLEPVKQVLAGRGEALVVLEAPTLTSASRLRKLIEAAGDGAAIGCYPEEGRGLEETIRGILGELGVQAGSEVVGWLATQLGVDRSLTRRELEKVALYAGADGRLDLDGATACVGDLAGLSLDDALFAATEGEAALADRALGLALGEGATPVGVLRTALMHVERLHRLRLTADRGMSPAEAVRAARPPIFFRRVPAAVRALQSWTAADLLDAMGRLAAAERDCKRTGAPATTICRHAVLRLAMRASKAIPARVR